ncbi:hypothetical protein CSA17_05245 [bacterium DOLJORAL78_65_58]|nr:MAG: hypothetical protein CSB20_11640 [bacterium DOLZORAL124_64_63]PIE75859.1 MAG: hypothetical protein CSA17_05245 [bacterium DOLJORAL78_65_58]
MLRNRLILVTALAALLVAGLAPAAQSEPHQKILVDLDTPAAQSAFEGIMGRLDILSIKPGHHAEIAVQSREKALIDEAGLRYKTLSLNMEAAVARDYGPNYGVYHTYSESVAWMDELRAQYPSVISEKWSIGQSLQGNDIWAMRVSDNPDSDEDEPEVFIDGMHHAREIMASEFPMMFAEYLAANYGEDPEITWLLDNRELYIVPIVNPDGQLYNEQTDPEGGGMWRKTRRPNGDGSHGVDPNRNYPYQWGYDNSGSSPYPGDQTYRGPSAGSEPCVQALMAFVNSREFVTHDSVHTYSNLLLYPWGYENIDTPHEDVYQHMAAIMTQLNGYSPGQAPELLYGVNGGSIDWVYGAQDEHDMILSFSTEIGSSSDGFWPTQARRQPLFEENIWPHIYLMRSAGIFIDVNSPVAMNDAKTILPGESGYLDFTIENQSVVADAQDLNLSVRCDDAWVQLGASEFNVGDLAAMGSTTLGAGNLPISVDAGCPNGHFVPFDVIVHLDGGDLTFNLGFMVGTPSSIFADDFENGLSHWTLTGAWAPTGSSFHSPTTSLTDSPNGNYDDQVSASATLNGSYQAASLSFWHKYDIEDNYDYGHVQVRANGGAWTTLASYDGTQNNWQQVTLDLTDYAGQDLSFRFLLETDYSVTRDGWYIDDVMLTGAGSENLAPAAPVAISPVGGAQVSPTPELVVANTSDPEGNAVTYGFRVYSDEACTQLVAATDGVSEGVSGQTAWTCDSLNEGTYYWRAYGSDGVERSPLSATASFTVQASSGVDGIVIGGPRLQVLGNVTGGGARLQLSLPAGTQAGVAIYDARGARVRQLHSGYMNSGSHVLVWDGRDSHGRNAGSGVYFVRVMAEDQALTGRVVVVR